MFAIVVLGNGTVLSISIVWLIQDNGSFIIVINQYYELYLPLHETVKQANKYAQLKTIRLKCFVRF